MYSPVSSEVQQEAEHSFYRSFFFFVLHTADQSLDTIQMTDNSAYGNFPTRALSQSPITGNALQGLIGMSYSAFR